MICIMAVTEEFVRDPKKGLIEFFDIITLAILANWNKWARLSYFNPPMSTISADISGQGGGGGGGGGRGGGGYHLPL